MNLATLSLVGQYKPQYWSFSPKTDLINAFSGSVDISGEPNSHRSQAPLRVSHCH